MQYKYFYTKRAAAKIRSFYRNVGKKYRHTYSYEDMERNVHDAFFAIYAIERTLPRRDLPLADGQISIWQIPINGIMLTQ